MRVIVDCALYVHGERPERPVHPQAITDGALRSLWERAKGESGSFVWVGLHDPTTEELDRVAVDLRLHPLAVEDAVKAHQRPKLEAYPDGHFVVLKTVRYDEATQQVDLGEVMLFLGDSVVITVRHGPARALGNIRKRLEENAALLGRGPYAVLYAVCDAVVDDYTDIVAALEDDISEVEEAVFSPQHRKQVAAQVYNLKRETIEFRRAVRPLVEPLNRLANGHLDEVPEHLRPYFRDVADHAVRVADQVDAYDDQLGSVLSANLAQVGVQQNNDMRRISAWVAIVAVPTMIAGIYGMNFEHMPELEWRYGYPLALGVMAVACTGLYRLFKRSGWL